MTLLLSRLNLILTLLMVLFLKSSRFYRRRLPITLSTPIIFMTDLFFFNPLPKFLNFPLSQLNPDILNTDYKFNHLAVIKQHVPIFKIILVVYPELLVSLQYIRIPSRNNAIFLQQSAYCNGALVYLAFDANPHEKRVQCKIFEVIFRGCQPYF